MTVDIARDRSKIFKKEEEKGKMRKSQRAAFFLLLFHIGKLIFVRKHTRRNLVYIVTFVLPFFTWHIHIHWFCRRHTSIQKTWYFNVDFDSNVLFRLFIYFRQVP